LKQLLELCKSVPLTPAQIPEYIEQQKREVQQLKEESEMLGMEILKKETCALP
jgi:hypothetical protein